MYGKQGYQFVGHLANAKPTSRLVPGFYRGRIGVIVTPSFVVITPANHKQNVILRIDLTQATLFKFSQRHFKPYNESCAKNKKKNVIKFRFYYLL